MDRRDFVKILGTASGGALSAACGDSGSQMLPLLVRDEEIVPGIEEWHPSLCRECGAGCGVIARVMEAERIIEVEGERVRQRIAAVKKVEGNPLDPVSGGRLCARGQASVQGLYHPDRVAGPLRRVGQKGEGQFEPVDWDTALAQAAEGLRSAVENRPDAIVYVARPGTGSRSVVASRFLQALGAPAAVTTGIGDFAAERAAAKQVFGWNGLPVYEIQDATHVLGLGADFLGGWVSPVFYARRFGHFRQGRPGLRGRLIQAEGRLSQTGWAADEWLPAAPGGEHALALAIGHVLLRDGLARNVESTPETLLAAFQSLDLDDACRAAGLDRARVERTARQLGEAQAPMVVAGASIVRTNSVDSVAAGNVLNVLLGAVGRPGGVLPPATLDELETSRPTDDDLAQRIENAAVVLLDGADVAYARPELREALAAVPLVVSFASMIDDSAAYADLVLPDHSSLESGAVASPPVSTGYSLIGAPAFLRPLHDTRATEDVLVVLAAQLERGIEAYSGRVALGRVFGALEPAEDWANRAEFENHSERQGGWWSETRPEVAAGQPAGVAGLTGPETEAGSEFPLRFQAYPSLLFGEGAGGPMPWLQQTPDPVSSAMWDLPAEIDPGTAKELGLHTGDRVRVTSSQGAIEAPVYVNPAAIPGVVSMAMGQGHAQGGRYAAGRGANPLEIASGAREQATGVPAFGSARVRIETVAGGNGLLQYSTTDRETRPHRS